MTQNIQCPDSSAVELLHAPEAEKVHMKDYSALNNKDLPSRVLFHRPLESSIPVQEQQGTDINEIKRFLKSNSLEHMKTLVRHNPLNGADQVYLLLEPYNRKFSQRELLDLQRAFSAFSELGLMIQDHHLYCLDELSSFIPTLKGLCIMGNYLEKIPESWRRSVEWLHCINAGSLIIPEFSNLKGITAPITQIIQCEKASMDVIAAPLLTRIYLIKPRKSPEIRSKKHYKISKSEQ